MANGTAITLEDVQAADSHFWLSGGAWSSGNGTTVRTTWAGNVDALTGAAVEWDLHGISLPAVFNPPEEGDRDAVIFQRSVAHFDRLFVASSIYGMTADSAGMWQPDETTSKLLLSSLLLTGGVEYTLRLDAGMPMVAPLMPLVTAFEGIPTVIAFPLPVANPAAYWPVYSTGPIQPSATIEPREIRLGVSEAILLYSIVEGRQGTGLPFGATVTVFVGEGFLPPLGFLGWRGYLSNPASAFVSVPAILMVDYSTGSAHIVSLAEASPRPDPLLDLASSAIFTVLGTLLLAVGYPRWRLSSKNRHPR